MVYIFESMLHMSQEEKLEHVRQQLIDQIPFYILKEV